MDGYVLGLLRRIYVESSLDLDLLCCVVLCGVLLYLYFIL